MRVRHILPLLLISSCSGNQWSEVDDWAAQEPGLRLVADSSGGRTYALPNVGQFGRGAVDNSFIVILFQKPDSEPIRWIIDFDCEEATGAAFSSDVARGVIRRDWLGDPVTANGRPFRLVYEGPMDADQKRAFCKDDWFKERSEARAALNRRREAARRS